MRKAENKSRCLVAINAGHVLLGRYSPPFFLILIQGDSDISCLLCTDMGQGIHWIELQPAEESQLRNLSWLLI